MFPQTVGQRDYIFHCLGADRSGRAADEERHSLMMDMTRRETVNIIRTDEYNP
jgi:hypothetical protein